MPLSINQKQNYLYFSLVILTILASVVSYRATQKKWLLLKEADHKFNEKSFEEAIVLYRESLAKGPTTNNALHNLADAYIATGNFSEGIKYYREYLNINPKDSAARLSFARALGWNGNIKESEEQLKIILEQEK